jgi:hypothetical protein
VQKGCRYSDLSFVAAGSGYRVADTVHIVFQIFGPVRYRSDEMKEIISYRSLLVLSPVNQTDVTCCGLDRSSIRTRPI